MQDFVDLVRILQGRAGDYSFDMDQTDADSDCAHLKVDWVQQLAQHLLDDGFTSYDIANCEILTHLYAYHLLPVRPQCVWGNRTSQVFAKFMPGEG